jgi:hypothetical protein
MLDIAALAAHWAAFARWRRATELAAGQKMPIIDTGLRTHPLVTIANVTARYMTKFGAAFGVHPTSGRPFDTTARGTLVSIATRQLIAVPMAAMALAGQTRPEKMSPQSPHAELRALILCRWRPGCRQDATARPWTRNPLFPATVSLAVHRPPTAIPAPKRTSKCL